MRMHARDFHIYVDDARVDGARHLNLLGVTLDRQLHMDENCVPRRKKVQPRTAQLRKLTGRTWGFRSRSLGRRLMAKAVVRWSMLPGPGSPSPPTHTWS